MDLSKDTLREKMRSGNIRTSACKEKRANIVAYVIYLQAHNKENSLLK